MKKLIFVLTFGLIMGLATSASAVALVTINDSPGAEPSLWQIYNTLYPGAGLTSSSDLMALENDLATGIGLFTSNTGTASIEARYSSAPVSLYTYNSGGDTLITYLPASSGYMSLSFPVTTTGVFGFKAHVTYDSLIYDWYSQKVLNDPADGEYHFVVLNTPVANTLLVGFEDMRTMLGSPYNSDWDYQDAVIELTNIQPVPEPATMLLLGSGLLGLAAFGRAKKRKI